jgi:hypothetical protein
MLRCQMRVRLSADNQLFLRERRKKRGCDSPFEPSVVATRRQEQAACKC